MPLLFRVTMQVPGTADQAGPRPTLPTGGRSGDGGDRTNGVRAFEKKR